ncbi:hypothetical protein CDV31_000363 [Fusarium ambrosium]|uniref:Uncharacterized protein n=2 Tax=Fusarium solani species complex TaxID=232080 RepID=A0A428V2H5_9HYPO|nr:hypothetical protein CDV31_000363 [Fusarium ambrosium]
MSRVLLPRGLSVRILRKDPAAVPSTSTLSCLLPLPVLRNETSPAQHQALGFSSPHHALSVDNLFTTIFGLFFLFPSSSSPSPSPSFSLLDFPSALQRFSPRVFLVRRLVTSFCDQASCLFRLPEIFRGLFPTRAARGHSPLRSLPANEAAPLDDEISCRIGPFRCEI